MLGAFEQWEGLHLKFTVVFYRRPYESMQSTNMAKNPKSNFLRHQSENLLWQSPCRRQTRLEVSQSLALKAVEISAAGALPRTTGDVCRADEVPY
jgi:hypothetical protein